MFLGQPVAIVVADTVLAAKKAAKLVEIEWEETSERPIFGIVSENSLIS